MTKRLIKIGDATSQWINATFFNGHPNESLSGRSYRENLPTQKWIDRLLWFDPQHCFNSYMTDLEYAEEYIRGARKRLLNRSRQ